MTDDLEERVEELEERLAAFEDLIEFKGADNPQEADFEDIWIGGQPVGKLLNAVYERSLDNEERIDELAAGEVDATELAGVDSEHQLEIQRRLSERKAGHDVSPKNLHRATFVWEEFYDRAIPEQGAWKLDSSQVRRILAGEDLDTNTNTVRRVMKQLAKHTGPSDEPDSPENLVQFVSGTDKNVLVADRDEWEDWASSLEDDVGSADDASDEVEAPDESKETAADTKVQSEASALMDAAAVTDDSDDPIQEEIGAEVGD